MALRHVYIRARTKGDWKTNLSAYWDDTGTSTRRDVTDKDISEGLKLAAAILEYPETRGIPIKRVDTHSLRGGGANALSLNRYNDTRWRGETFKEYIREELATFAEGMSKAMKKRLNYVVVSGGAFHELASDVAAMTLG